MTTHGPYGAGMDPPATPVENIEAIIRQAIRNACDSTYQRHDFAYVEEHVQSVTRLVIQQIATAIAIDREAAAAKIREYGAGYYDDTQAEGFEVAARIAEGWLRPAVTTAGGHAERICACGLRFGDHPAYDAHTVAPVGRTRGD